MAVYLIILIFISACVTAGFSYIKFDFKCPICELLRFKKSQLEGDLFLSNYYIKSLVKSKNIQVITQCEFQLLNSIIDIFWSNRILFHLGFVTLGYLVCILIKKMYIVYMQIKIDLLFLL
jgi:hypothetical protein